MTGRSYSLSVPRRSRSSLALFVFVVGAALVLWPSPALAASPAITMADWDGSYQCDGWGSSGAVTRIFGTYDIDTFTRDALAGEVYSDWHAEALRANAVLNRSVARYHDASYPLWNHYCSLVPDNPQYDLHRGIIKGYFPGKGGRAEGIANNRPSDRVTDTMAEVLVRNGQFFWISFNDCLQSESQSLAQGGMGYVTMLTNTTTGLYRGICGIPQEQNVSIQYGSYSLYGGMRSLTNGTSPTSPGGTRTDVVTEPMNERQAEQYWGHGHMDALENNPFGQPGTYMVGWHNGERIEFLMKIGGGYYTWLAVIGISDRPQPVSMNIWIDGYYNTTIQLSHGDNQRHLAMCQITGLTYGTHAVGIEYVDDYYAPGGPDQDRNLYLDSLGVSY